VGAREHAKRQGFQVVYDKTYPPSTVDYSPIVRPIKSLNPDVVFVASYPPYSTGMILAPQEVGSSRRCSAAAWWAALHRAPHQAGPKLNGIVDYGFWSRDYVPC